MLERIKTISPKLNGTNKYLLILLGFSIPVSTAVTNIILGLILLFWLVENIPDRFQKMILIVKSNPVASMAMLMFLFYLAGASYTIADKEMLFESLLDGVKFLFIPMMMIYFKDRKFHSRFMLAFMSSMLIILLFSYLFWLDMLPDFIPAKGVRSPLDSVIFHDHIKQNVFMAYAGFVAAVWSRFAVGRKTKILWGIISLVAAFNVFFLVAGRTGHLIMVVLFTYYFLSWHNKKSLVFALIIVFLTGMVAWFYPSNAFLRSAKRVVTNVQKWDYEQPGKQISSSGLRLEWYLNSVKLIRENPVIGTGTGSFKTAFNEFIKDTNMNPTDNPHNEYLMTGVQFGLMGLIAFLAFFMVQWNYAKHFKEKQDILLSRGFVLTILCACMVSSPIQDHAEGWFFALMSAFLFSESKNSEIIDL